MLSRYTITHISSKSENVSFMNLWKADSVFDSPKGMTSHSKDP